MARKIIQIAITRMENTCNTQCNSIIVGLCDDGSVWTITDNNNSLWERLPDIPQDKLYRNDLQPPPTTEWR